MTIAIIGSGGDGAGMNECLYTLCAGLADQKIVLFNRGLQGIIENDVVNFSLEELKAERKKGGIIIKSSRSTDFLTDKGFKKCLNNLKKNNTDILIIMGGNGSLAGARKLSYSGVNVVFIPTTIDNDIAESDYTMGFDTACNNAIDFVQKVDISMKSFDRICIYEVMGRHCDDIAQEVGKTVGACFVFTGESKKEDMLKAVKKELKTNLAPIIILQENTTNIVDLADYLKQNLKGKDIKYSVIGYVQRGGYCTAKELKMAQGFAKETIKCIKKGLSNVIVRYIKNDNIFEGLALKAR